MKYPNASTEPLEIIRLNECEADPGLATQRFQACFNEIERLREALDKVADSCCASTGCGCHGVVTGYAKAALSRS